MGLNQVSKFLSRYQPLHSDTESRLEWNDLRIGGDWPLTNTTAHVWTSPRAVQTAAVKTVNGESEKFLFYRGIAHIDAPLKITRDTNCGELLFHSQLEDLPACQPLTIHSMWLVDILSQRKSRIPIAALPFLSTRIQKGSSLTPLRILIPASSDQITWKKLKASLQKALVADGLFADEAQALLNTWELSYFKSVAGLRDFLPRAACVDGFLSAALGKHPFLQHPIA